jgi:dihydrolipoamide dehydrogenase
VSPERVGCLVVGGGPGGIEAAAWFARSGRPTMLVERAGLGGACLHVGCIPAKLLLDRAHRHGVGDAGVAWKEFRRDLSATVARHERGAAAMLRRAGVEVVHGEARPHPAGVAVTTTTTTTTGGGGDERVVLPDHLVLATGSRPCPAPFPVNGDAVLTSDDIFTLEAPPASLVVIGGGAVGAELADAFCSLGTAVTLVEAAAQLLPGEDTDLAGSLADALAARGISIHLGVAVAGVDSGSDSDGRSVRLADGRVLTAEAVLLAVGRQPNAADWPLPPETRIHEIGDRAGGGFAHQASAMGQAAAAAAPGASPPAIGAVARCVYTSPAVAAVGLTAVEAADAGINAVEGRAPWSANPMADIAGLGGLTKVVAERATGRLLGVHIVGDGAPELAALAAALVDFEAGVHDAAWLVFPHPTLSETVRAAVLDAHRQLDGNS